MDENQDMDGIIFYHPYGRQCFPVTWMNIKTGMKLYFMLSINSYEYQDTDEILFYHPYGRQSSAPYFSISWILGNMKTDDVISSIHTDESRKEDR
jgi:hypothetical protein